MTLLALCLSFAQPAQAQTAIQVQSDNFTLSGEINAADAIDMVSELERFRSALFEIHNIPTSATDQRVDMYIVSDPEIFKVLGLDEGFVAIYQPTIAGPRAIINGNTVSESPTDLRHSLRHEYVHHFNAHHRRQVTPRWLEEGLAEYFAAYEELPDGQYRIGAPLDTQQLILTYPIEGWYPLKAQFSSFSKIENAWRTGPVKLPAKGWQRRPDDTLFFYAQNWALVHYMQNQPGGMEILNRIAERSISLNGGNADTRMKAYDKKISDYLTEQKAKMDDIERIAVEEFGRTTEDFLTILQSYATSSDMSVATYSPKAGRISASITTKNLSDNEAAAAQYRLLSLTSSNASINETMKTLKAQLEADPTLKDSLLVSDAAQQFMLGWAVKSREQIDKALALDPNAPNGKLLQAHIHYQEFANGNYANGSSIRQILRPLLVRYPDDADLLVKMALTSLEDMDNPAPEVSNAIKRIETTQVVQRSPITALPLANLYAAQEDYAQALYIVRRGLPFVARSYELNSFVNTLEDIIAEDAKTLDTP
ncbi:hypothetical protein N9W89_01740 [Hellea sp.]|nr:hypothetical protein [Hellea sp.]